MNTIIIFSLIVGWFVVALVIAMALGYTAEVVRKRSETKLPLEQGDFENDRPRPAGRLFMSGIWISAWSAD